MPVSRPNPNRTKNRHYKVVSGSGCATPSRAKGGKKAARKIMAAIRRKQRSIPGWETDFSCNW